MKQLIVIFLLLITLCYISLAVTFGYEEGTMQNEVVGRVFSMVMEVFRFPVGTAFPSSDLFILSLWIDTLFYAFLLRLLLYLFRKTDDTDMNLKA